MAELTQRFEKIGVRLPQFYLPGKSVDLTKWAVIACDQYTSEKEYWNKVEELTEGAPSTLNLIFPEVYLEEDGKTERIEKIQNTMKSYVTEGIVEESAPSLMLVRRDTGKTVRWGLVAALDLERYDYKKGSTSLIRATEGTIEDRLPPRMQIRNGAPLEFPHIMVLINDQKKRVIEPLAKAAADWTPYYDFDLMMDSGRLTGYKIESEKVLTEICEGLEALADADAFERQYGSKDLLTFAPGLGNHSFATAKAVWEQIKAENPGKDLSDHPARFALVELNNLYDPGLLFEPIYRVIFDIDTAGFRKFLMKKGCEMIGGADRNELVKAVNIKDGVQRVGLQTGSEYTTVCLTNPQTNLAVGSFQNLIDEYLTTNQGTVDYIHGLDSTETLAKEPNRAGVFLPDVDKDSFFETVIKDGALPRKTFSMGEAFEKRFYMEARKISR